MRSLIFALPATLAAIGICGCGAGSGSSADTSIAATIAVAGSSLSGRAMGGQQPVVNVAIQLYAVGTTGYGSAATPLLKPGAVVTDANGGFGIGTNASNSFSCPSASTPVYLVGTGGQPIAATPTAAATTNPNLALMVGLGACGALDTIGSVNMNEVTTVATVWALSPFMTGIANVGSPATNLVGLTNAFAAINKLSDITKGTVSGPSLPAGATLPASQVNALANILAQCVNSSGGSASDSADGVSGTNCGNLFYLSSGNAAKASDTITAALGIAQNPGRNVAALSALAGSKPPFQPTLGGVVPAAWTIAINYVGGGLSKPTGLAVDAQGAVWTANAGNNSVTKLNNTGAAVSGAAGFTAGSVSAPSAIATDQAGHAWVANQGNSTITMLDSAGGTGTVFQGNGVNMPISLAVDGTGTVWVANSGTANAVSGFNAAGTAMPAYTGGGLAATSIAVSPN